MKKDVNKETRRHRKKQPDRQKNRKTCSTTNHKTGITANRGEFTGVLLHEGKKITSNGF